MDYIKTEKTIILREAVWESIVKDTVTFGLMFIMFYLNHKFTDGSWFIDFTITLFFILMLVAKTSKGRKEMTLEETIKYLESKRDKKKS